MRRLWEHRLKLAIVLGLLLLMVGVMAADANGCWDGTDGAIVRWTMNNADRAAGNTFDICFADGVATNGTENGVTTGMVGVFDEAYDYDGANDYVYNSTSIETQFAVTDNFSWNVWANTTTDFAETAYLFGEADRGTLGKFFSSLTSDEYPRCVIGESTGGDTAIATYSQAMNTGDWFMVTCVYWGHNKTVQIYVNGTYRGSDQNNNLVGNVYSAYSRLSTGAMYWQGGGAVWSFDWDGGIDEAQIFNYSLPQTQITELYANGWLGITPSCSFTPTLAILDEAETFTGTATNNATDVSNWWWTFNETGTTYFTDTGNPTTQTLNITGSDWQGHLTCNIGGTNYTSLQNITVHAPPDANFTISTSPPLMVGSNIQFTDTSTDPVGVAITAWWWDFGDGNSSNVQNGTNTFISPGHYNVCLTAQDARGLNSSVPYCENVTINGFALSVYNEQTTAAVNNWNVTVYNSTYTRSFTLQSNTFTWSNYSDFPIGLITIDVAASGYVSRTYYGRYQEGHFINLNAYLLDIYSGVYPIFNVVTPAIIPIENALIAAYRNIGGSSALVAQKYTDSVGEAMFYLDPLASYTVIVTKTGYDPYSGTISPASREYIIILAAAATNQTYFLANDTFFLVVQPYATNLEVGTDNVTLTLHDPYNNLNFWNFTIYNATDHVCLNYYSVSSGGGIYTANTSSFTCTVLAGTTIAYEVDYNRNTSSPHTFRGIWHTSGYGNFSAASVLGSTSIADEHKELISIIATIMVGIATGNVLNLGVGMAALTMAATSSFFAWAGWLPPGWIAIAVLFALGGYAYSVRGSGGAA